MCFRIQREAIYAKRLDLKCCELDYSKPGCKRCHIPLVVENVRGAQPWVGRSAWNYGSFHLWGDVPALMPINLKQTVLGTRTDGLKTPGRSLSKGATAKFGTHNMGSADKIFAELEGTKVGGDWFSDPKSPSRTSRGGSTARKAASAMIAKIPLPLSTHIARVYKP